MAEITDCRSEQVVKLVFCSSLDAFVTCEPNYNAIAAPFQ